MTMARVQPRGQVTIPQDIRGACGIEPGTYLLFIQTGPDSFQCQKLPYRSVTETIERLMVPGVAPDLAKLREEMGDEMAQDIGSHLPDEELSRTWPD